MTIQEVNDNMDVGFLSLAVLAKIYEKGNPEANAIVKRSAKKLKKRKWLKR